MDEIDGQSARFLIQHLAPERTGGAVSLSPVNDSLEDRSCTLSGVLAAPYIRMSEQRD